jgi:hypothetical protein
MEVGEFDDIRIDDRELSDACSGQRRNDRASDPPGSDHRNVRGLELALPDTADLRQDDVPRVSLQLFVG